MKSNNEYIVSNNSALIFENYTIDWDKINSIEDIKLILKNLKISVNIHSKEQKEEFRELFEKNLLIEKVNP